MRRARGGGEGAGGGGGVGRRESKNLPAFK